MPDAGVMFAKVTAFPAAVSPCDLLAAERADLLAGRCCDGAVRHVRDPLRGHLAVPGLAWPAVAVVAAARQRMRSPPQPTPCDNAPGPAVVSGCRAQRPPSVRKKDFGIFLPNESLFHPATAMALPLESQLPVTSRSLRAMRCQRIFAS